MVEDNSNVAGNVVLLAFSHPRLGDVWILDLACSNHICPNRVGLPPMSQLMVILS